MSVRHWLLLAVVLWAARSAVAGGPGIAPAATRGNPVVKLNPESAIDEEALAKATARGKALVEAVKWRAPAVEGMWRLQSEVGGPVIVLAEKSIMALSKADGKVVWKVIEGVNQPRYMGGNDKVAVVLKTGQLNNRQVPELTAFSLADGTEKYHLAGAAYDPDVQIRGNLIVTATGQRVSNSDSPAPRPQLTGYDLNTGKQLWQRESAQVSTFLGMFSETEYLAIFDGVATMLDARTGETKWERPKGAGWKNVGWRLDRPDGTCVLLETMGNGKDRPLVMDLKTGQTEARNVEFADGALQVANGDVLVLVRQRRSPTKRGLDAEWSIDLTEEDKKEWITVFEEKTGKVRWKLGIPLDHATSDFVKLAGDVLLLGHGGLMPYATPRELGSWTLTALDMADGSVAWKRENVIETPVPYKELVIVRRLNALEAVDRHRKALWTIPTTAAPGAPLMVEGVMYVGMRPSGGPDGIYAVGVE